MSNELPATSPGAQLAALRLPKALVCQDSKCAKPFTGRGRALWCSAKCRARNAQRVRRKKMAERADVTNSAILIQS